MDEFPGQVWSIILTYAARWDPRSGMLEPRSLLHFAGASKRTRACFIQFIVGRDDPVSGATDAAIDAIIADPAHLFDQFGQYEKFPKFCVLRPLHVSDLTTERAHSESWSFTHMSSVAANVSGSSCPAHESFLLSGLAPAATCIELIVHAKNVDLGRLVLHPRIQRVFIDRDNRASDPDTAAAPVAGSIEGDGVTRCVISSRARSLSGLVCIRMPRLVGLLIGCNIASLRGIARFTGLRSLAIKDTGSCALSTIRGIGALKSLTCVNIGFSLRAVYERFVSSALPSLSRLDSITVRTPRGAADQFLRNARDAGACLTGLTSLGLLYCGNDQEWEPFAPCAYIHLPDLPAARGLRDLSIYGEWTDAWASCPRITGVTKLGIDAIDLVRADTTERVTSLASLGIGNMRDLQALTVRSLPGLQSLGDLRMRAIGKLEITKCDALLDISCIATMASLVHLGVTECTRVRFPPLTGLTGLEVLSIDLEHYLLRHEPNLYEVPRNLRRLRFNSGNSITVTPSHVHTLMGGLAARIPLLRELAILSWDGQLYHEGKY
jgi:hypothetical protein